MKSWKHFYLGVVFTTLFLMAGWAGLVWMITGQPTEATQIMYSFALKKRELAKSIEGPKMLLLGGSNVIYGVNAKTLTKGLGIPTVNCAVSRLWGPDYILWDAKRTLKRGDIVVFMPEFDQYSYNGVSDLTMSEYIMARDMDYFGEMPLLSQLRFFYSIEGRRLKKQALAALSGKIPKEDLKSPWDRLDENGDLMIYAVPKPNHLAGKDAICRILLYDVLPVKAYEDVIKRFKAWADENGVLFLVGYPSLYAHELYVAPRVGENIKRIQAFYAQENIPLLGDPKDFFYEAKYMFDGRDHLTNAGRDIRTAEMEKVLRPYVKEWLAGLNAKKAEVPVR